MRRITEAHRSQVAHAEAVDNIRRKTRLLEEWVAAEMCPWLTDAGGKLVLDDNGERCLDWIPETITDLAAWTGDENCAGTKELIAKAGGFRTFGRSTLYREKALMSEALSALKSINRIAQEQLVKASKTSTIERLEFDVKVERSRKEQAQARYLAALERVHLIGESLKRERRLRKADVERLSADLSEVRAENARLTAAIAKVKPIAVVQGTTQ